MNVDQPLSLCKSLFLSGLLALLSLMAWDAQAIDVPSRNPALEERGIRLAREALAQKDWGRAVSVLQTHVKVFSEDADAYSLLGYAQRQLGRFDLSLSAYERALAIDPRHLGAHAYLGILMLTVGQRERAVNLLKNLSQLCQTPCEAMQQLQAALDSGESGPPKGHQY